MSEIREIDEEVQHSIPRKISTKKKSISEPTKVNKDKQLIGHEAVQREQIKEPEYKILEEDSVFEAINVVQKVNYKVESLFEDAETGSMGTLSLKDKQQTILKSRKIRHRKLSFTELNSISNVELESMSSKFKQAPTITFLDQVDLRR